MNAKVVSVLLNLAVASMTVLTAAAETDYEVAVRQKTSTTEVYAVPVVRVLRERFVTWLMSIGIVTSIGGGVLLAVLLWYEAPGLRDFHLIHAPFVNVRTVDAFNYVGSIGLDSADAPPCVRKMCFFSRPRTMYWP